LPIDSFSDRVWHGDASTVGEARIAFLTDDSEENLFRLAVALYSFRDRAKCAELLCSISDRLIELGTVWETPEGAPADVQAALDRADCLSTYLLWLSRQDQLEEQKRDLARALAYEVAVLAQAVESLQPHTAQLLLLTAAEAKLESGEPAGARALLDEYAATVQPTVLDQNQRARIMRKYGYLRRRLDWWRGTPTILGSALLPGITLRTSLKSLAALIGVRP
jgi:hypothetical protein